MWKWTGLVLCLLTTIVGSGVISYAGENATQVVAADATSAQRRIFKILIGHNEAARLQLLSQLRLHRDQANANLVVLMAGTRELLAQQAEAFLTAESVEEAATAVDEFDEGDEIDADIDRELKPKRVKRKNDRQAVAESLSQLLHLLGSMPADEAHVVVTEALDHPDPHVAMIAMDTIGEFQLVSAVDDLTLQIKRPAFDELYAFRFALVRALARLHCPESIEWLQRLSGHVQGQLHHEISTRLANVDLRDFGGDHVLYDRYREQQHQADFAMEQIPIQERPNVTVKPASAVTRTGLGKLQLQDAPSESQGKLRLTKSQYYGIDLNAGRILFIIDHSGSMRGQAYRETRLQSAKRELIHAIGELAPETEFAIMLFETGVQSWRDSLLPATQENKHSAIEFVKRIEPGDRTNTHGVLSQALLFDDQLEAVFVLTDGQPTAGSIIQPPAIIVDVVGRNRMRHLKFHTIGIGVNPMTSDFLKTLAIQTGGEYRRVD